MSEPSKSDADKAAAASRALVPFERVTHALAPYPEANYHHLVPTIHQEPSSLFRPAVAVLKVDATDDRDCYPVPGSGKKTLADCGPNDLVVLHGGVLERMGNALGIDWDETQFEHAHVKEPNICLAKVGGWFIDPVGARRRLTASAKSDLRDGGPVAKFMPPNPLNVARQFICERTESRARNRAIRKVANLRSSYKKAELAKPFLALRWRLDENDPDVKRAMIAAATGTADAVYGRKPAEAALPVGVVIDAGESGPAEDEHLEGDFTESPPPTPSAAQPVAAAATPAAPAAPPIIHEEPEAANPLERMDALHGGIVEIKRGLSYEGKPWGEEARSKPTSAKQYGMAGGSIVKALPWKLSDAHASLIRHAVMTFAAGAFESWDKLRSEDVSAVIEWAKAQPDQVREVVTFLVEHREDLAPVKDAIVAQPELLKK